MAARGLRNNNPGNIIISTDDFIGEVKSTDKKFKKFATVVYGYRAMFCILHTKIVRHKMNTIRMIIESWAPEEDGNDTEGYIRNVCSFSKINENRIIDIRNEDDMCAIGAAISRQENGVKAIMADVKAGYRMMREDRTI